MAITSLNRIERDFIIESKTPPGEYMLTRETGFDLHRSFAKLPDVSGYVLSRGKYGPFTMDILVTTPDAATPEFKDKFGRGLRQEVEPVADRHFNAAEQEGDLRPKLGEYIVVGETVNPNKIGRPLRRSIAAYEDFAKKAGRGTSRVMFNYYYEETPFSPIHDIPDEAKALIPKNPFVGMEVQFSNPALLPLIGAIRQISTTPEVKGLILSGGVKANFLDVLVNSATNPQEVQLAAEKTRDINTKLTDYLANADIEGALMGGLVEIMPNASWEEAKTSYLDFAAKNRRLVAWAFYFTD